MEFADHASVPIPLRRKNMFTKRITRRVILVIGALLVISGMENALVAQKAGVQKPQDKLALGENEVRQLILLIDNNNNGKITKNEWMAFMEAEFDRLEKNKTEELDPKELAQSRIQVIHSLSAGK